MAVLASKDPPFAVLTLQQPAAQGRVAAQVVVVSSVRAAALAAQACLRHLSRAVQLECRRLSRGCLGHCRRGCRVGSDS